MIVGLRLEFSVPKFSVSISYHRKPEPQSSYLVAESSEMCQIGKILNFRRENEIARKTVEATRCCKPTTVASGLGCLSGASSFDK